MSINYIEAKYIGSTCLAFDHGKIYKAVGYDSSMKWVSVVDESNENYLYHTDLFEFSGSIEQLPEDFPDVYQNNGVLECKVY